MVSGTLALLINIAMAVSRLAGQRTQRGRCPEKYTGDFNVHLSVRPSVRLSARSPTDAGWLACWMGEGTDKRTDRRSDRRTDRRTDVRADSSCILHRPLPLSKKGELARKIGGKEIDCFSVFSNDFEFLFLPVIYHPLFACFLST